MDILTIVIEGALEVDCLILAMLIIVIVALGLTK